MMRWLVLVGMLVVTEAVQAQFIVPPGPKGPDGKVLPEPYSSISSCVALGFDLKTTTAILTTERDGTRFMRVTHYLQKGTVVLECTANYAPDMKYADFLMWTARVGYGSNGCSWVY
jgi:hypothetical protein